MNITSTNLTVGSTSNIIISLDRTKSIDGSALTPTTIGTSTYIILVSFDQSYTFTYGITAVTGSTYTLNTNDKTITIVYNSTLYNGTLINLTIIGVKNPLISTVALKTFVRISDSNNVLKD